MIAIFTTHTNTSVAVCINHRYLAEKNGWSYLEKGLYDEKEDWPCYFARVDTFWHISNGFFFHSRDLTIALQAEATTLEQYRQIVKRSYGSLRGIKFGTESGGATQDHDSTRLGRMVASGTFTQEEANDTCCCMLGYNGCCGYCHNSCPCCEGVGQIDYGAGPTCLTCNGTGEGKGA